jgi:hypothetical protein
MAEIDYYKNKIIYSYGGLLKSKKKDDIDYMDMTQIFKYYVCIFMSEIDNNKYFIDNNIITSDKRDNVIYPIYTKEDTIMQLYDYTIEDYTIVINDNNPYTNLHRYSKVKILSDVDFIQYCNKLVVDHLKKINNNKARKTSLLIDDIFILICNEMGTLKNMVKLQLLSQRHKYIIRTEKFHNQQIIINNNALADYLLFNYNFKNIKITYNVTEIAKYKYVLKNCYNLDVGCVSNVDDNIVQYFGNCNKLNLEQTTITDKSIKYLEKCNYVYLFNCNISNVTNLRNCHTVDIGSMSNRFIKDDNIIALKHCNTLILKGCWGITNKSIKQLGNCYRLDISYTNASNSSIKYLGRCHILNVEMTQFTGKCSKYLKNVYNLNVGKNYVTDLDVKNFCNCYKVNLSYTRITDKALEYLVNCHTVYVYKSGVTYIGIAKFSNCNIKKF